MHERHALHYAFMSRPETVHALLKALPAGEITPCNQVTQAECETRVLDARNRWLADSTSDATADAIPEAGPGAHYVFWQDIAGFFLEGIVYPEQGRPWAPDERSPVVLIDRFEREILYGPLVADLGYRILGEGLAKTALASKPTRTVTYRTSFSFAPWLSSVRT